MVLFGEVWIGERSEGKQKRVGNHRGEREGGSLQ